MFKPLAAYIGLRYTRAKRRNHFISFIAFTSMIGVALGLAALITIISIMNGFELELRERILGMTAHISLVNADGRVHDWPSIAATVVKHEHVVGVAPYIRSEIMLARKGAVEGAILRGILPSFEPQVSSIADQLPAGKLDDLVAGEFRIILGAYLAKTMRVTIGDTVAVIVPTPQATPIGRLPRMKRFTVSGYFEVGMHEYDTSLALVHLEDAAKLFRFGKAVSGVRVKLDNALLAPAVRLDMSSGGPAHSPLAGLIIEDWTETHANFFRALKTEKMTMFVILGLIVAVAAFNIISSVVMVVTDKRADIAILMTLGMSRARVLSIFLIHGAIIGLIGVVCGSIAGLLLAANVTTVIDAVEKVFHFKVFPPEVYYISHVPSQIYTFDVLIIIFSALGLCLLATVYPAWMATRIQPAQVLRYE